MSTAYGGTQLGTAIRFANSMALSWRNADNSADVNAMYLDSSNTLALGYGLAANHFYVNLDGTLKGLVFDAYGVAREAGTTAYPSGMVDRGDPSGQDWIKTAFTADGNWYDLDCSSIVPDGARFIWFKVSHANSAAQETFALRKNGNSNIYNTAKWSTALNSILIGTQVVACDTNRVVEYQATNGGTWGSLNVLITAWAF
jgi:hypothetical protein